MSPAAADEQRRWDMEAAVTKAWSSEVAAFAKVFISGNETGAFDATASQALFLRNGDKLTAWLTPAQDNLSQRMFAYKDTAGAIEEAYWAVYGRQPNADERELAVSFVDEFGPLRLTGYQTLVRAMLCSAEFRLNH